VTRGFVHSLCGLLPTPDSEFFELRSLQPHSHIQKLEGEDLRGLGSWGRRTS
jgi:hypothetical protein